MAAEYTEILLPEEQFQVIGAQDYANDPNKHFKEVMDFATQYKMSFGQALNYIIKPDDESTGNTTEDYLERRGFALETTEDVDSTPCPEIFSNEADTEAAVQWAKDEFFYTIHDANFWKVGTRPVQFVGDTRGSLPEAINKPNYGMLQATYLDTDDIMLADIIARRIPIRGSKYIGPNIEKPKNYKLTGIAELGDIPTWKMTTGSSTVETEKAGYGNTVSYELLRTNGNMSIEALGEFSRMLGFLTLQEMINNGIQIIAEGADDYTPTDPLDKEEFIKLVGRRKVGTRYNTVIGSLEFMAAYLGIDLNYASSNRVPGVGPRSLIEQLVGEQKLGIRESEEVPALTGKKGVLFDKRYMLEYIFERGGEVNEEERKASNQSISYYSTFNYTFKKTEYFDDAKATLATLP